MATTSLSLGEYWEEFIKQKVESGRYGSASELVRDGLRLLEERESKIDKLRAELVNGEQSGTAKKFDMEKIKRKAKKISSSNSSNA